MIHLPPLSTCELTETSGEYKIFIWGSSAEVKECVELYPHSPITPSWRGAQFKESTGTTLPSTFTLLLSNRQVTSIKLHFLSPGYYKSPLKH
jgi:hypothetical protein